MQDQKDDKTYEESIASDIFNMITTAKGQGLDLNAGFQNEPLSTPKMALRYFFYGKREMLGVPGVPAELRKKFRTANVMAAIFLRGKIVGLHLICALGKPFGKIETEAEVLAAIDTKGLAAYAEHVRAVLKDDLEQAITDTVETGKVKQ